MRWNIAAPEVWITMHARAVEEADARLRALRQEEWGDLGLGALALVASVVAAEVFPPLALPLFLGGLVVGALGVRALWRRWDLLERLAGECDAYGIPEVRAQAAREATMERRESFAALIRSYARTRGSSADERACAAAEELEALADELEDEELELDPAQAVACMRLVSDLASSPLLNRALPTEDLRSYVLRIRSGFSRRAPGPAPAASADTPALPRRAGAAG